VTADRPIEPGRRPLARPVAFVGLPGAGKSTVGRQVAAQLAVPFVDFDTRLAEQTGLSVAQLFAEQGEAAFRRLEYELTSQLLTEPPAIWAPGGGWLTAPGVLARIGGQVSMIHLLTRPETALARLAHDTNVRPLLAVAEPDRVLVRLQQERAAAWATAQLTLDTDSLSLPELVDAACAFARRAGPDQDPR
jgi:shikimate kinase